MKEAVKLVPVVVLLTASVSLLAQERSVATEAKPSSQKMMVIDPKVHEEMMTTAKEMDKHLQVLKTCLNHERAAGGQPTAAEREASDAQIQALERSIQQLRQQTESGPHYLDQTDSNRP